MTDFVIILNDDMLELYTYRQSIRYRRELSYIHSNIIRDALANNTLKYNYDSTKDIIYVMVVEHNVTIALVKDIMALQAQRIAKLELQVKELSKRLEDTRYFVNTYRLP